MMDILGKRHARELQHANISFKNRNNRILAQFKEYKSIVERVMIRRLYDKQVWDSFFMYAMKKAGNFSIPGSGKIVSVLGVFAFLKQRENIRSIIIICPLNSFDSWKLSVKNA